MKRYLAFLPLALLLGLVFPVTPARADGLIIVDQAHWWPGPTPPRPPHWPPAPRPYAPLEVVYHHVDLDAGPAFGDLPDDLVAAFLADEITRLRGAPHVPGLTIRTTEGDAWAVGDGSADVTGTRAGVLAWLARGIPDGIDQDNPPTLPEGR